MNNEMKQIVNNLTKDILQLYKVQTPINIIDELVYKLNGRIEYRNDNISAIAKSKNSFVIYISPNCPIKHRIFLIAHELGHLFLHMGYRINSRMWNEQRNDAFYISSDIQNEFDANYFALALLMPEDEFNEIICKNANNGIVKISDIADYFNVSNSIAHMRGKTLNYFK